LKEKKRKKGINVGKEISKIFDNRKTGGSFKIPKHLMTWFLSYLPLANRP
jgi:hypothetical protein